MGQAKPGLSLVRLCSSFTMIPFAWCDENTGVPRIFHSEPQYDWLGVTKKG